MYIHVPHGLCIWPWIFLAIATISTLSKQFNQIVFGQKCMLMSTSVTSYMDKTCKYLTLILWPESK